MARRHEIQNLLRRGNIYYWRPRIPAPLADRDTQTRLSLSLRLSDHRKAGYMARRLNTLLHDLRLGPTARMTTKDQLAALFRAEIDRMHDHLDDLALIARRTGNADDVWQLEADLEVGWAYGLLQLFGGRRPLTFEGDCPGRALLIRNGIPEPHVANIAATFASEQQGMRNGVFEEQVKARMAEFGIPDTVLNRERALTIALDHDDHDATHPPVWSDHDLSALALVHLSKMDVELVKQPCATSQSIRRSPDVL